MINKQSLINIFLNYPVVCNVSDAYKYLELSDWDLYDALEKYYEDNDSEIDKDDEDNWDNKYSFTLIYTNYLT